MVSKGRFCIVDSLRWVILGRALDYVAPLYEVAVMEPD
jgi:hypothetical protein